MSRPLLSVFAVEDDAVQITWRALPADEVLLSAGGEPVLLRATPVARLHRRGRRPVDLTPPGAVGGPGTVILSGLRASARHTLRLTVPGNRPVEVATFHTLPSPPGQCLTRFATLNDIHIGQPRFGAAATIEEAPPLGPGVLPVAERCARAAAEEAVAWGASVLVVKGDLTRDAEPAEFAEVGRLLRSLPVPVEVILGNHDVVDGHVDARAALAREGVTVPDRPWHRDLPGIRLVMGDSNRPRERYGRVDAGQRTALADLAAGGPAAFVALHHEPHRWRWPNLYPPGIPGPEATALLDALAAANPATVLATGHTHRNRRHGHGPVVAVETGSTKDYPGGWAGYAVHEGGIRQVIRRVGAPDVMGWTEATAAALYGWWGRWSPGRLDERCFTHPWPGR